MSLTREDLEDIKQLMESVVYTATASQFKQINEHFDAVDKRFEEIDKRFEAIDTRFDEAEALQNEILQAVSDESATQGATLDHHETRITRLEKAAA